MAGGIQFSGLGSGLDSQAIIQALLQVEKAPIQQLEGRKQYQQERLKKLDEFKALVDELRTKSDALSTLTGFLSYKVGASSEGAATFSASSSASAGTHTLLVHQLAASDRWAFDAVAAPDVNLAGADGEQIAFTYEGVQYTASVSQSASTLNDIAAAIKTAAGGKVDATVVNTGTASAPSWQLVLAGKSTGEDFRISGLSSTISGLSIDGTPPDPSGVAMSANNILVARNAIAEVDGLLVQRSNNDFSAVVEGVSISLLRADPTSTVTFTVEPDKDAIQARLKEFVEAYNNVTAFVRTQNTYDKEKGVGGVLFGDGVLRSLQGTIRGALFGQTAAQAQGDVLGYGSLAALGIKGQSDGSLTINESVLDAKLDGNLQAFTDLFVDTDGFDNGGAQPGTPGYYIDLTADRGMADELVRAIDRVVKTYQSASGELYKGIFDARTESIQATMKLYDTQIEARERRLEQMEQNLQKRFTALERLMAQLQSQGAYLNQAVQ